MSRNPGAKILRDNEEVTKAAMAFGAEKGIKTTQTVDVQGWSQEIPEVNGVFEALTALQKQEHKKAEGLLSELQVTTDNRRRGEIRRHYNTVSRNIERNNQVLNALMDKKVGMTKKTAKPKKAAKATKPKQPKKRASPSPAEVKKKASTRKVKRPSKRMPQTREEFKEMPYKEVVQMAKGMGINAFGKKHEIVSRILREIGA